MWTILLAMVSAAALVVLGDLRAAVPSAIAVMMVWGVAVTWLPKPSGGAIQVVVAAVMVRIVLLAADPSLSDDVFRYLWEGRAALEGGNPYLHAPSDAVWAAWGPDPIRDAVNHPDVPAVYPPLALLLFGLLGTLFYGPVIMQLAAGLADAGIAFVLARILKRRGRSLAPAWLYALHPLGVVESAGSAHVESIAILAMVLAIDAWDRRASGVGWAFLGSMLKLLPAVLIPRLWRRQPWLVVMGLVVAALSVVPFLDAGPAMFSGLEIYARQWSFGGILFPLLDLLFGAHARWVALGIGALVVLRAMRVHWAPERIALWAGGAFVMLSPTVHPWYVLWAWVPALLCGVRAWTVLATLMPLSYVALMSYEPSTSTWDAPWWPAVVMAVPFLVALCWEVFRHGTLPGPWGPLAARAGSVTEPEG
jgi:hypothetical protein